jgi:capsular exopolysaccharide synthesis family protein
VTRQPNSAITESFRALRASLRLLLKENPHSLIAVHSVNQGEGKSFIAVNLAAILSLSGKKVLLLELDKRSVQLTDLTGAGPAGDLSDYLVGKASFADILSATKVKGLSFAKAAKQDVHMAELMDSPQMEKFIKEARASFDFIVADNPPVGILSDARAIASYADANLFVLRMGVSTNKELSFINRTAEEESIRNMIVVLNDVSAGPDKKSGYFNE